ncbi:ATP-binding cassette domain-containing protein [Natronoglycomyces albus]|uniref:ATP-binding cassette domain-containing protein n=1 Tax=Natronoglycomyces albus TaxID=2811108 RepID=A0A895XPZ2_9ACTN|nr:ATP-binding cassette domain-containing protein [Natronoglycomyces albus]QSB05439.1 ATP-binding cassette domain-containing protein [Natronoglycomyces albus]
MTDTPQPLAPERSASKSNNGTRPQQANTVLPGSVSTRSDLAVNAQGLVKHFGDVKAVDGVDLAVPAGTVYGVLGPNGAGKTTAVKMLATLLRPDSGSAEVFGTDIVSDPAGVRSQVSMTGQYASLDEDLTGFENLVLLSRLHGYSIPAARERASDLFEAFGLSHAASKQVKSFSGGMRRRLDIAASIINTPKLLFLDEPTTGLDPRSRNQVWEIIRVIVEQGATVLLTTQYLEEADQLASRIAVIDTGHVIAEGTPGQLKSSVGAGTVKLRLRHADQREHARELLSRLVSGDIELGDEPVALAARLDSNHEAATQAANALAELARGGIEVEDFSLGQPSLDEVFLALTAPSKR